MTMVRMDPETLVSAANHWLDYWGMGGYPPGSFTKNLIVAIAHADRTNTARLALGFPEYVLISEMGIAYAEMVIANEGVLAEPDKNFKDGSDG